MSLLFSKEEDAAAILARIDRRLGPIDFLSETFPFDFTPYYEREMGKELRRRMVGLRPLISPKELVQVKRWTDKEERRNLNPQGGRKVNIDPGYLAPSKFILATGKDYSHRIYLGEGVYGDLTLRFQNGKFAPLPWTYPDYGSNRLLEVLGLIRKRYLWQLKNPGFQPSMGQEGGTGTESWRVRRSDD
jgi:hypothetical protein